LQVHDFNGGVAPSGLFWTRRLPDDAVVVSEDGRQLIVAVQDLALIDDVLRPVAITKPATVSFRIEWRGKKAQKRRGRGLKVGPTDAAAFLGRFRKAKATATMSGAIEGFSFATDVATPATSMFAMVGTERNGTFLVQTRRCGRCAGQPIRVHPRIAD
jgi:hypothetical protein